MPGKYEQPITINEAIQNIVTRKYLLPAIQRNFTWETSQIEKLFDSIMRDYPINTLMLWKVTDPSIKTDFRFYQFLEKYCERFNENNPEFDIKGQGDFYAVIDGQQRLTSLYIGLKGTYAYRLPRRWWPKTQDDTILPPRRLYLNIADPVSNDNNEEMMAFEFKFLTVEDFQNRNNNKYWFLVGDILDFQETDTADQVVDVVMEYLEKINLATNQYARKTLTRLYFAFRKETLIHYYTETSQKIDHVLDIFIRTNSGGTSLSFSNLLMSIAVANWKSDAREQIDNLVNRIRSDSDIGFSIDRDWILKAALTLTDQDIRFQVKNFTAENVEKIESQWEYIKPCILETFRLIRSFGLNDASLRAKNAAIPIAYYLYHQRRDVNNDKDCAYLSINRQAFYRDDRKLIRQWLHMSLLKSVFGGQGDTLLSKLRKTIKDNILKNTFPLSNIIKDCQETNKNLLFDNDFPGSTAICPESPQPPMKSTAFPFKNSFL